LELEEEHLAADEKKRLFHEAVEKIRSIAPKLGETRKRED
jgi:hypothetical protein